VPLRELGRFAEAAAMQARAVEAEALQHERQDEEHARHHTPLADQPLKTSASPE